MNQTAAHDDRLEEALAAYFKAVDAGQAVDRAALLAGYPDLADDLAAFFADQDQLGAVLAPLRALSPSQVLGQRGTADERPNQTTDNPPNAAQPPTTEDYTQPSGDRIGKFTVVRRLGAGGQASAILAFDPDLERHVVLKLFREAKTAEQQETVLREGRALTQVHSPYVAQVHDVQRLDGIPYLVVEYIPGPNLAELIHSRQYEIDEALRLVAQLAQGLTAVHACGLLHRDLKPPRWRPRAGRRPAAAQGRTGTLSAWSLGRLRVVRRTGSAAGEVDAVARPRSMRSAV